ncbi:MAG: DUF1667 domain-containing protein [Clostridia bacterium]|nr:DUF1667 domain-containing protein [Clostridia bacterium]
MKERFLTCIVCPKGCPLKVTFADDGSIANIEGYTCKRGIAYAEDECTHPKRTVTSTVKLTSGVPVAVKTTAPVPKELVFDVMREINSVRYDGSLTVGDVVIKGVCGLDVDVVATANS